MQYEHFQVHSVTGITVSRRDNDLIAVKAADPADPTRRRAEAELLARLDHPGIVQFVDFVEADPPELHTRYEGTDTWARTPPPTLERALAGLAAVASTIADLHDLGICHGALAAEHVVVGSGQRPILCGLADARPHEPTAELDDMVGLAGLIRDAAAALPEPSRTALDDLARRATTGELTARPLADELLHLNTEPITTTRRTTPRRRHVASGLVALAMVAGLAMVIDRTGAEAVPTTAATVPPTPAAAPTSTAASTTTSPPTTTSLPAPTTIVTEATDPDEPAAIEFVHDGRRYGLGAAGDVAVLGDWDCDGIATPALLQRGSAIVAVFDQWPEPDSTVLPTATAPAPGATDLEAIEHDGCDQLRIIVPDGSHLFTPET